MPLYGCSAIASCAYVFGFRSAFKLLGGVAMLVGGVRFRDTVSLPASLADAAKYVDFDTELGRETGGLSILLVWFAAMILVDENHRERELRDAVGAAKKAADGKPGAEPPKAEQRTSVFEWLLVLVAGAVLLSTYVVPKFVMKGPAAEDHCNGVGFSAGKQEL